MIPQKLFKFYLFCGCGSISCHIGKKQHWIHYCHYKSALWYTVDSLWNSEWHVLICNKMLLLTSLVCHFFLCLVYYTVHSHSSYSNVFVILYFGNILVLWPLLVLKYVFISICSKNTSCQFFGEKNFIKISKYLIPFTQRSIHFGSTFPCLFLRASYLDS